MSKSQDIIHILIADDHEILRYGITTYLNAVEDVEIVGEASSGKECVELYEKLQPDLCVLDVDMPDMDGIETARAIRRKSSDVKILILSMHVNEDIVNRALKAGVNGYLLKNTEKEELLQGIRAIMNNQQVFSETVTQILTHSFTNSKPSSLSPRKKADITKREHEILILIVEGYTSQEIAEKLYISPRTVDTHRANLMEKLHLKNTADLVRYAIKNDLVSL
ncbi:MAG: response regulator transcription factor [Balneolaceae bacterium]|nr:response regulator transcription factor [Balneolaceae bacterium]